VDKDQLKQLIEDDDLGLLDVKPKAAGAQTEDERLAASYEEISAFVDEHGKEPEENFGDLNEHRLHSRLKGIRTSPDKVEALREMDRHSLLGEPKEITSIDDVLDDDDLGILDSPEDDIFTIRNVPEIINKADYIGKRKPCKDFGEFKELFVQCHADLKDGKRKLLPFRHDSSIKKNRYYVHSGVLLYVASFLKEEFRDHQDRHREDFRLRCIYENGTESDILRNSLGKRLRENGRRVTEHEERMLDVEPEEGDEEAGFIYILQSLSDNPEIKNLENLYKIGYSRVPVEDRIKNAERETTYLMAPVKIISTYQCYNLNTQKFEHLLHRFFGGACLNIDVFDENNKRHTPREWFVVPLSAIEETIELIINETITDFVYDARSGKIVAKVSQV
jgi:hypothetical protein